MSKSKKTKTSQSNSTRDPGKQRPGKAGPRAMRVEVKRINFYDKNPRHSKNPEYDRIKASILASGMDQPLLITQRPGDIDYFVQAGGNTRLRVLQELFEATDDERFRWVDCLYVDWDRESSVLLAHLRENELRGNLTFIDKARAVIEAKNLIIKELGVSDLSQRRLEKALEELGYNVSHGLISQMGYAVSVLLPLLPIALELGLGKPQVQRIRNLERVGREIWRLRDAGTEDEFDETFRVLCRRYDGMDWHIDLLIQALENEIAEAADMSIQVVRMEFDCRLAGHEPYIPDFIHEDGIQDHDFPGSPRGEPATISNAEQESRAITGTVGADGQQARSLSPKEQLHSGDAPIQPQGHPQIVIEMPSEPINAAHISRIGIQSKKRIPLELLREMAYTLAQRLAERHGMGALIVPLTDNGLGYLVRDIPDPTLVDQLDDELLAEVSTMWWQLRSFAEMSIAPPELLVKLLDEKSALLSAASADKNKHLNEQVWVIDPDDKAMRFWRQLNHADWCDWLCLAHNYRELHRVSRMLNTPLWHMAA